MFNFHDKKIAIFAQQLAQASRGDRGLVLACSALKRSYRDLLRSAAPTLAFVYLQADRALLEARLATRRDHYMPASLVASQLETLEAPGPDERAVALDAALPNPVIAERAAAWLAPMPAATAP